MKIYSRFLIVLFLLITCSACDYQDDKNSKHPILRKADLLREKGDFQQAVTYYKKYLQGRPNSSYTHLKLAVIYDENLQEPIAAIYHYREFLALNDNENERAEVELWLNLCEKRLAKKDLVVPLAALPEEKKEMPPKEQTATSQVLEKKDKPQEIIFAKDNPEVKSPLPEENAVKQAAVDLPTSEKTVKKETVNKEKFPPMSLAEPENEFPKEYVVKRGDTLSGISKKFYGTIKHYKKIMQANNLENANQLKVGKKIVIPKID